MEGVAYTTFVWNYNKTSLESRHILLVVGTVYACSEYFWKFPLSLTKVKIYIFILLMYDETFPIENLLTKLYFTSTPSHLKILCHQQITQVNYLLPTEHCGQSYHYENNSCSHCSNIKNDRIDMVTSIIWLQSSLIGRSID
jgi:hypothetical protein